MSLSGGNHLVSNVVDAWSRILNSEEKSKGPTSVHRFFFSTVQFVILCTDKGVPGSIKYSDRHNAFFEMISYELREAKVDSLQNYYLVFFPVVYAAHFCLFVINHFTGKIDVIDNKALDKGVKVHSKYKGFAKALVKAYYLYMKRESPNCLNDISVYASRHLKLKWKDSTNNDDCGVFLLKHMESYFGQDEAKWDIGVRKNKVDQLKNFRIEYCWKILSNSRNKEVAGVNEKALKWKNEQLK
ncbi:uncharacterized protein [Euphorbia lathyris]|uniref:uncharacterized protein n=1 Tax=Euphorbia lathyris TaxID=212925 RepID=UPI0033142972